MKIIYSVLWFIIVIIFLCVLLFHLYKYYLYSKNYKILSDKYYYLTCFKYQLFLISMLGLYTPAAFVDKYHLKSNIKYIRQLFWFISLYGISITLIFKLSVTIFNINLRKYKYFYISKI